MKMLNNISQALKNLNTVLKLRVEDGTYDFDSNATFRFEMWDSFDGQIYLTIEGIETTFDGIDNIIPTIQEIERQLINKEF